jgi:hypothetical protein
MLERGNRGPVTDLGRRGENVAGTWSFYDLVSLSGSGGVIAHFSRTTHPVTFIDFPYNASATITVSAGGSSRTVDAGRTTPRYRTDSIP